MAKELKCPICDCEFEEKEVYAPQYDTSEGTYLEVELKCPNDHVYFTRITKDDLIEA